VQRDPARLIPALPPLEHPADTASPAARRGGDGGAQQPWVDPEHPPESIARLLRATLAAMGLPQDKVRCVVVGGVAAKSTGSARSEAGARVGLPMTALDGVLGLDLVRRCSPLPPRSFPGGWDSAAGRELHALLLPEPAELAWVLAHECAHIKHEDSVGRGLSLAGGLLAYHATTRLLWRELGYSLLRRGVAYTGPTATLLRCVLVGCELCFVLS
jgi:hypothetical protein